MARSPLPSPARRALVLPLAALLLAGLAGCGGSSSQQRAGSVAPPAAASARVVTQVYGTRDSAQQVAAVASQAPTAAGPRSELAPLSPHAFDRPVARYRRYAIRQARAMRAPVARLQAAIAAGDRSGAQAAWGGAYDRYLLLGAAYGALGDLDVAIDGTPGHLPGGARDPRFTGLHRIEHDLWSGRPLPAVARYAARLRRDVGKLPHALATVEITPLDYATRAHEIMEDAQRDMLSGRAAPWSGAGLRATGDGLSATRAVIATLRPVLSGRGDALGPVEAGMQRLGAQLAAVRRAHGGRWPALSALTHAEHQRVDGQLGALLEALSEVPGSLETALPPAVPTIASQEKDRR